MNFLAWFLPDWLSNVPATICGAILKAIKTAVFSLDTFIYRLIIDLYDMFMSLCSTRLLSTTLLQSISKRIGYVLGLVMLFVVIFSFIEMLLNPDSASDKEKGAVSVIKKVILVIVMLGMCNFVFDTLFYVQNVVVQSNVISKLLLPYSVEIVINGNSSSGNGVMDNAKFGSLLSEELFMAFYKFEEFDGNSLPSSDDDSKIYKSCQATVNAFRFQIINYKRFDLGYNCLNEDISVQYSVDGSNVSEAQETSIINFNWPLSVVCGIAVVYLLFMYCLKVGVRMVQLMFLEVISPMAIVSYLTPKKDTMFNKWKKLYISTYIDVFIRIAIINFVFFLIATVFSTTSGENEGLEFWDTLNPANGVETSFYVVVIVLALLTFAKKAPELLKELLPAGASKLGFGASMKDIVGLQKGLSTVAGAATGAAVGFLGGRGIGAIGGILRGAGAGFGAKNVHGAFGAARKAQAEHNVAARLGQLPSLRDRISAATGSMTTKERYDRQVEDLENLIGNEKVNTASIRRQSSALSNASGYKKKMEERAENKLLTDNFSDNDVRKKMQENLLEQQAKIKVAERSEDEKAIAEAQIEYNKLLDTYKQDYITLAAKGAITDNGMNSILDDFENEIRINADGAFDGMTFNRKDGYAGIKKFDDAVTTRNSTISRDIAISDAHIKEFENQVQGIKNSQGYIDSHRIK